MKMGLPVNRLCAATNRNDIVDRVLARGDYHPGTVSPTKSPSMDIQVASNFERLLFEESGRDPALVRLLMETLKQSGGFALPETLRARMATMFTSGSATEDETDAAMDAHLRHMGLMIDPHTAVGRAVAGKARLSGDLAGPVITLATAHPAKFPEAVAKATGASPALPAMMADLLEKPETMNDCANDTSAVRAFIRERVGPGRAGGARAQVSQQ